MNLISNAIKFSNINGHVVLDVWQSNPKNGICKIKFIVRDDGCGIDDELKKRLFLKFEQGDESIAKKCSGSGLGLSIVKSLTVLMQGTVSVESKVGIGSEFEVIIPFKVVKSNPEVFKNYDLILTYIIKDKKAKEIIEVAAKKVGLNTVSYDSITEMIFSLNDYDKNSNNLLLVDKKYEIESIHILKRYFQKNKLAITLLTYDINDLSLISKNNYYDSFLNIPLFLSDLIELLDNKGASIIKDVKKHSYDFTNINILVVEDQPINAMIVKKLLINYNANVEIAVNGKEAVENVYLKPKTYYNLIFMDLQMPGMDGYTATRLIREFLNSDNEVLIYALTANNFISNIEKSLSSGMDGIITKPFIPEQIYKVVNSIKNKE